MFIALIILALWLPALQGLGITLWKLSGGTGKRSGFSPNFAEFEILGLAFLSALGTLVNFVMPIFPWGGMLIWVLGCLLLAMDFRTARKAGFFLWVPAVLIAVPWLVAISPNVAYYDAGHYHLPSIKWASEFPLAIGAANLFNKLGMNSSWVLIQSCLSVPFAGMEGAYLANPLISILTLMGFVLRLSTRKSDYQTYFGNFLPWIVLALTTLLLRGSFADINSTSSDVPVLMLGVYVFYLLLRGLETPESSESFRLASVLSCFAVTVKFSAAPLFVMVFCAFYFQKKGFAKNLKGIAQSTRRAVMFLAIPWVTRGILLSGCLAFPLEKSCLPFIPWMAPKADTEDLRLSILRWARNPWKSNEEVLSNWEWFRPWLVKEFWDSRVLRFALIYLAVGTVLLLWARLTSRKRKTDWTPLVFGLVASALSLAHWFLNVPYARFGFSYWLSLGALVIAAGCLHTRFTEWAPQFRLWAVRIVVVVAIAKLGFVTVRSQGNPLASWPIVPDEASRVAVTSYGSRLNTPTLGDQCWEIPLPCTPKFSDEIAMGRLPDGRFIFLKRTP